MPETTEAPIQPVKDELGTPAAVKRGKQEAAVVEAAATTNPSALSPEVVQSATDWFLAEEPEQATVLYFDLNVAAAGLPARYIRWGVRALQRSEIRSIRNDAQDPNTGIEDDMEVNMRVLITGSVDPNLVEVAQKQGLADPADLVNRRFAHRPGLIEAIARKINEMGGYGAASAQLIRPVDAAGN